MRSTLCHDNSHNASGASLTRLPRPPENSQFIGVTPPPARDTVEVCPAISQSCATIPHRAGQNLANRAMQPLDFDGREGINPAFGMDSRQPERFIHINVSKSGHDGLIQKNGLDHAGPAREPRLEYFRSKSSLEGFRPQGIERLVC